MPVDHRDLRHREAGAQRPAPLSDAKAPDRPVRVRAERGLCVVELPGRVGDAVVELVTAWGGWAKTSTCIANYFIVKRSRGGVFSHQTIFGF